MATASLTYNCKNWTVNSSDKKIEAVETESTGKRPLGRSGHR